MELLGMSVFVSPVDESSEEEGVIEATKEECELGVVKSWLEVGGFWCLLKRKHRNCCGRYIPFGWYSHNLLAILPLFHFTFLFLSKIFIIGSIFFRIWIYWKEPAHWRRKLSDWRLRGLEKLEVTGAGMEVEGLYMFLRGAILNSSISSIPPLPKNSPHPICHHL